MSFDEANEDIISLFRQLCVIGGLWMNKVYHSENKIYKECSCNEFILIKKELVIVDYLLQNIRKTISSNHILFQSFHFILMKHQNVIKTKFS